MKNKQLTVIAGGDGVPPEPQWEYQDAAELADAAGQWRTIVAEMRDAGTLAVANGHAIKRLVEFRVQYERAARHVAEHGAVLKSKRAEAGVRSRHWTVMREADEAVRVLEAELGIAPVRRGKVRKVQKKAAPRSADTYLSKPPMRPDN